jgi:hypothetical protein
MTLAAKKQDRRQVAALDKAMRRRDRLEARSESIALVRTYPIRHAGEDWFPPQGAPLGAAAEYKKEAALSLSALKISNRSAGWDSPCCIILHIQRPNPLV